MKARTLSKSALALRYERAIRGTNDREASLRVLGKLARKVCLDRNANGWNKPGMPKGDRLAIKAEARPFLREAIHWIRKSRDALLTGDIAMYELLLDRARMYRAFAALEFFQPYANKLGRKYVAFAEDSSLGGKATAEAAAMPELDDLIRACLKRGEKTRNYTKEWAQAFNRSDDTIRRHIKLIKASLARG